MEKSNFDELKSRINLIMQDIDIFFVYGIIVVSALTVLLCYLDIWQYYFLVAFIGGIIAGYEKEKQGSVVGALGVVIGASVYLNFTIISSIGAWDLFVDLIFGFTGAGVIGILLAYLLMVTIGGLSGYTGALSVPIIQSLISRFKAKAAPEESKEKTE